MQLSLQLLPLLALLSTEALAQYKKDWQYKGSENIGKYFKYSTIADPSGGYVKYVDEAAAHKQGMVKQMKNSVRVGADSKGKYNWQSENRNSVRLESHKHFGPGLIIADFEHIPGSTCGTWPAFWMLGDGPQPWPAYGEIDIIEGVNKQKANQMTLHTTNGCSVSNKGFKGIPGNPNCISPSGNGCDIRARNADSFGDGFNKGNGGVYAMQWTDDHIAIWNWARKDVPGNIKNNSPDPSKWGMPVASFHGNGCNIKQHFKNMYLILNVDFCGPWAVLNPGSCSAVGDSDTFNQPNCRQFVANNPSKFKNSYFEINDITYYKRKAGQHNDAAEFAAFDQEAPAPAMANETQGFVGAMGGSSSPPTTRRSMVADFEDVEAKFEERDVELEDDVEAEFEERDAELDDDVEAEFDERDADIEDDIADVDDINVEDVEDLEDF